MFLARNPPLQEFRGRQAYFQPDSPAKPRKTQFLKPEAGQVQLACPSDKTLSIHPGMSDASNLSATSRRTRGPGQL